MPGVLALLAIAALISSVLAAMGKAPGWLADILLSVVVLLLVWGK
jgi:hypothetical protein